jgi:ABC-2 type transport system permease protein
MTSAAESAGPLAPDLGHASVADQASVADHASVAAAPGIAALIAGAPQPRPTLAKTFIAMLARDLRVLRRNAISTFARSVVQPLLFVFVFTYVLPKVGGGILFSTSRGGLAFSTILVPGLVASMLLSQGILAVTYPLVMEFSWQRTIEDRALAPVPIQLLALEKIIFGATQSLIGGLIVFPIVLVVHASGQAPHVQVTNWPLLALILVAAALLASCIGLVLGTIMDPRKMQMLFAMALLPATMLGCVYYPWTALHNIRWLQVAVLVNPMVYMSEGLRAILTPRLNHLPMWAILLVLVGGSVVVGWLGARTFARRVIT